jgi:hypothetical protein
VAGLVGAVAFAAMMADLQMVRAMRSHFGPSFLTFLMQTLLPAGIVWATLRARVVAPPTRWGLVWTLVWIAAAAGAALDDASFYRLFVGASFPTAVALGLLSGAVFVTVQVGLPRRWSTKRMAGMWAAVAAALVVLVLLSIPIRVPLVVLPMALAPLAWLRPVAGRQ